MEVRNSDGRISNHEPVKEVSLREGLLAHAALRSGGVTEQDRLEIDRDFPEEVSLSVFGDAGQGRRTPSSVTAFYTQEQLNDHAFYMANKADIFLALKEGRVLPKEQS